PPDGANNSVGGVRSSARRNGKSGMRSSRAHAYPAHQTGSASPKSTTMRVPLTVRDFIERAELVYGDRIGVVDEPDQPAESLGELTWTEVARLARAQAAGLDALGVAPGERVAIVSHNSARLLTSF